MSAAESPSGIVLQLAEEFLERYRQGERPSLKEYIDRHPELAAEIREVFPAMAMMENIALADESLEEEPASRGRQPPEPLQQLGDYRIIREVGRGGMGIVYEAEQVSLGRHVALKVLPRKMLLDARQKRRFEREARAAARLHHTNIVPVFGVGEQDGMPYYVMQFIQGQGLDQVLDELKGLRGGGQVGDPPPENGSAAQVARSLLTGCLAGNGVPPAVFDAPTGAETPPPAEPGRPSLTLSTSPLALPGQSSGTPPPRQQTYWQSVAQIGVQVAGALEHAHGQGILHRDIKPSNLLLDTRGTVWVTDFGLAKADDQPNLTHTGDILGTLRYMPPEAFEGTTDARGALYSLGLTLYELLAFRPAFGEQDRARLIRQVTNAELPRLGKLNPHVPRDLETIVHKAIDRDPAHRYQTAGELAADLQRFLDDEPIRARRTSPPERLWRWARHNKAVAAALSAVALLLVVIAAGSAGMAAWNKKLADDKEKEREKAEAAQNQEAELRGLAERQGRELRRNLYFAEMNLAGQAAAAPSGIGEVGAFLANWRHGEPDLRGWEWYYLKGLCHRDLLTLPSQNKGASAVAWSPDGRRLASAGRGPDIEIWDPATGKILGLLHGHTDWVLGLAWSPDGARLAAGSADRTVRVWDMAGTAKPRTLRGHDDIVTCVAWSPDGQQLASGGRDGSVRLWDWAGGRELRALRRHNREVRAVAWSPDGTRLASAGWDHTVKVWDRLGSAVSGTEVLDIPHISLVDAVAWSPDGKRLASGSWDQTVKIWDAARGTNEQTLAGHLSRVFAVAWSPDGKRLASAGGDGNVKVWDVAQGRATATLRGHTYEVLAVAWNPDGSRLASGSLDRTIKLWDPAGYREAVTLRGSHGPVRSAAWSPDGKRLAFCTGSVIMLWDPASGEEPHILGGHNGLVWSLAWSPDGTRLAVGGQDGTVNVQSPATGGVAVTLFGNGKAVRAVAWSPDGRRLAAGSEDGVVRILDVAAGQVVLTFRGHGSNGVTALAWSPDGAHLASGSWDQLIKVWDAGSGAELFTLGGHGNEITALAWTGDGTRLASASGDRTIKLWDAATGKETLTLRGHTNWPYALAWSPDGRRLASASEDGTVKLWDPVAGKETLTLRGHDGAVRAVAWSPDGRRLTSGGVDGTVKVYDATVGYTVARSPRLLPLLDSRIAADPRSDDFRLRAEVFAGQGEWDKAAADFRRCLALDGKAGPWFQTGWWVVGPYPDDLGAAYPPEDDPDPFQPVAALLRDYSPEPSAPRDGTDRRWRATDADAREFVDLGALFDHAEHISAYALLRVFCGERREAAVLLGSDDGVRLWLNGKLVHENPAQRAAGHDQDAVPVILEAGWNTLLAKVVNVAGDHALYLRLSGEPADLARARAERGPREPEPEK
jgi:WD40 repeat protein/serine/threonine protein kinase